MPQVLARVAGMLSQLLYKQTILILTLLFCVGVTVALGNMSRLSSRLIESHAVQNAELYTQALQAARTLYSSQAVERLKGTRDIPITHDYASQEGAIPLPATYLIELGQRLSAENEGMSVRLYSDYPFPWRRETGGARDEFEQEALDYLRSHPEQSFIRFMNITGQQSLRFAKADVLRPSCIDCHNSHPDSPKTDWQVGDVRGILEIITPLESFRAQTRAGLRGTFATLALLSLLGLSGLTLAINHLRQTSRELERRVVERTAQLQETNAELLDEQQKSEELLLNILPESIARQLKAGHNAIADNFAEVTILFADIVGFTQLSEQMSPKQLLNCLNEVFSEFDYLSETHDLEKIKTIGDAYMVVGGLPKPRPDHAQAVAAMALDMQQAVMQFNAKNNAQLSIRIGINTGPVVAGVIGKKKFIYDLWGDAVNTASRMESHGLAGCIQVTEATYKRLQDDYWFEARGCIPIKGKGEMNVFLLKGRKIPNLV